jgi:sugar phosphate isomerase/epimerase
VSLLGSTTTGRRVGVDSYAYHRLLGEVRPGEEPARRRFERGTLDAVAHARTLGLDAILLETSLLGAVEELDVDALVDEAGATGVGLSWGAPDGFAFGARPERLGDLLAWLEIAPRFGLEVARIVAGGPCNRGGDIAPLVPLLREACAGAAAFGLTLALENHADLRAHELEDLLERVGDERLRVCFDTANALRVGDDPAAAATRLAPAIAVLHVKDCASGWDDRVAGPVSVAPGEGVIDLAAILAVCPGALACAELGQLPAGADELALVEAMVDYIRAR